jgi:uncharacterized protein
MLQKYWKRSLAVCAERLDHCSGGSELPPEIQHWQASIEEYRTTQNVSSLQQWNPSFCGALDIRIDRQGAWTFNKSPITRKKYVGLFSSILVFENNHFFLKTPVEKIEIQVETTPFLVVDSMLGIVDSQPVWFFLTNVGEVIEFHSGDSTLLFSDVKTKTQQVCLVTKAGHLAMFSRNLYYALSAYAVECPADNFVAWVVKKNELCLLLAIENEYTFE